MAEKTKPPSRSLESLANEMYRILIRCGLNLDGCDDGGGDDLRDAVAGIVVEMDNYYVRKSREVSDG